MTSLRFFVAVAEHPTFTKAAAALGIARPRLSRAMIDLEAERGVSLFDREAESMTLTDAGIRLLDEAHAAIAADDIAVEERRLAAGRVDPFRIAFVDGVTLTKWTREWEKRHAGEPLEFLSWGAAATTGSARIESTLAEDSADVVFARLPIMTEGLSVIPLYREIAVVMVPKDHAVASVDSVVVADLADEHLLLNPDSIPEWRDVAVEVRDGTRRPLPPIRNTEDAVELVAAGVGIVIVPQSVARLFARKDVVYRPVTDVAETQIVIAWLADRTTDSIEEFVGIVRGRTAKSSRAGTPEPAKKTAKKAKSGTARSGGAAKGGAAKGGRGSSPAARPTSGRTRRRGSR